MSRSSGRFGSALLFILLGLALLLFTTGYTDWATVWTVAIPGLFVLLGLWALLVSRFRNLTGPVLVVVIAGTVLLQNLDYLPDGFVSQWWPLVFVLLGVLILVGRERRRRPRAEYVKGSEDVTVVSIFGGTERRITSRTFVGGDVLSVFGGAALDFRDATVDSPPAVLEVLTIFGGVELLVPDEWDVRVDVLPIFGGTEDLRTHGSSKDEPDLVLTGLTVFGGIEIRD